MPTGKHDVPPPFDQGVFLVHYNRGREAFQEGRYAEARKELEAAQRFRPTDSDVLNLLGLVYFKTSAFPEAEVIYRRLVEENPSVFILHSNLGLILFKQGKIDESEGHLLKSIELRPNYAKSHLYLGLLYRQKRKLGLALEHLRFGGADKLVRDVETEMRTQQAGSRSTPPAEPAKEPAPEIITARMPAITAPPPTVQPAVPAVPFVTSEVPRQTTPVADSTFDDTSPLPTTQPLPKLSRQSAKEAAHAVPMTTAEVPLPPAESDGALKETRDTALHATEPRTSAPPAAAEPEEVVQTIGAARRLQDAVDDTSMIEEQRLDLRRKIEGASKTFTLHDNGFLEINFHRSVYVKRGTVSSYSGNLKFQAESGLLGTTAQTLVKAMGEGRIFVFEKGRKTFLLDLHDEFIYVEGRTLLALEDSLAYRVEPIYDAAYQRKIDTVKIFGRGSLAISTAIEPLTMRVTSDYPLSIRSNALVAWTGSIRPVVLEDSYLSDVMIESTPDSFKIRFEGDGVVVSEQ